MRVIYILAKFYPFWTIPLSVVLLDLGRYFRRLKSKRQHYCWGGIVFLGVTTLAWFIFRGDAYSDRWVSFVLRFGL